MRLRTLAVSIAVMLVAAQLAASHIVSRQPKPACTPGGIVNFQKTGSSLAPRQATFTWDAPSGAPSGTVYEVVALTVPTYCSPASSAGAPTIYSTMATQFTIPLTQLDVVYDIYVREAADNCIETAYTLEVDTFTSDPLPPPAPAVAPSGSNPNGSMFTFTFSYSDPHAWVDFEIVVPFSGKVATFDGCAPDPKTVTRTFPAGTFQFRLVAHNDGTAAGTAGVPGPIVTLTVGPVQIASFTAAPTTIRSGQNATLSWSVNSATSVRIDPSVGPVASSGSVTVSPSATTTYTLTATQGSSTATATATVEVLTAPIISVTAVPQSMIQIVGGAAATTTYSVANSGGATSVISLSQTGTFFSQQPATFSLAAGATQVVTVTGSSSTVGEFEGTANVSGAGAAAGLQVPIRLLVASPPTSSVTASASAARVDVAGAPGTSPTGSVSFTNSGGGSLTGVLSADVPWIIPQSGLVSIAPGTTGVFSFTIDRSRRPDAAIGSASGNLAISFLTPQTLGKRALGSNDTSISVQTVRIVDTTQTAVTTLPVPALAPGEISLVVGGIGHTSRTIAGAPVTFASDVSLLNAQGDRSLQDVKLFFMPTTGAAKSTTLPATPSNVSVVVADVAHNIFGADEQLGGLHIRSSAALNMNVAGSALALNAAGGSIGSELPVFRSDRAAAAGDSIVLTGLRRDASTFTQIYIQEMTGNAASVQITYYAADGSTVGTPLSQAVQPFALLPLPDPVPQNAVVAIINNTSTNSAAIFAYATAVDENSGDTWLLVDWSHQLGYAASQPVIIAVVGSVHGANGTFYRSDVAITNRGTSSASGTLTFYPSSGTPASSMVSLAGLQTSIITDVIASMKISGDLTGYLVFTPANGSFAITARAYTSTPGKNGTFSADVPVVGSSIALTQGGSQIIAALQEADRRSPPSNPAQARPGTFRSNFALLETGGGMATVRVTLRYPHGIEAAPSDVQTTTTVGSAQRDFVIGPHQFLLLNSIADQLIGSDRTKYHDLQGIEADFQVLSGDGSVVIFTSTVDNGTGDSIIRMQ